MKFSFIKKFIFLSIVLLFAFNCDTDSGIEEENIIVKDEIIQWGTEERDVGDFIVKDQNDNIYVVGTTNGSLDGESKTQCEIENCGTEIFITKFDKDNNKLWIRIFGTKEYDIVKSLGIDPYNNIYIGGSTSGNFYQYTNKGKVDNFLIKINSDGIEEWTKQWGTAENETISSINFDTKGNVYILGYNILLLDADMPLKILKSEMFFIKFLNSGEKVFEKKISIENINSPRLMNIHNDKAYIAGVTINEDDNYYLFFKKIELNSGIEEWSNTTLLNEFKNFYSIIMDKNENLYMTGFYEASKTEVHNQNIFLTKFNNNLEEKWIKKFGTLNNDTGKFLGIYNDKIYILGNTSGSLDNITNLKCQKSDSFCYYDIFLAKFSIDGRKEWIKQWGTEESDMVSSLIITNSDIYITGYTYGIFPNNKKSDAEYNSDIFLIKTPTEK